MALIQSTHRTVELPMPADTTGDGGPLRRFAFKAMGADCMLQFVAPDDGAATAFEQGASAWVHRFEGRYTRFRETSLVSQINQAAGAGWVSVDEEMERMLDFCGTVHFMSQGIVDVTAGPLVRLWNYHTSTPRIPTADEVATARELVGWGKVERAQGRVRLPRVGMSLDFGGWGKEFAVDMVVQMAIDFGISRVLVDFGHDIRVLGTPPGRPAWHIGLEDPAHPTQLWGSVAAINCAVASSGDYQRGFTLNGTRYGHILDPRTGRPAAHGLRQVTVIAPTCLQAGLLSTSAFVLGPDQGLALIQDTMGAEGCMVSDQARHQTRGFFQYVVS